MQLAYFITNQKLKDLLPQQWHCQERKLYSRVPWLCVWSGLPFPSPGDLPDPGIEVKAPASPALAGRFFHVWATSSVIGGGGGLVTKSCLILSTPWTEEPGRLHSPWDSPGRMLEWVLQTKTDKQQISKKKRFLFPYTGEFAKKRNSKWLALGAYIPS